MHSTLTYFSFLSFSATKVHYFCEINKSFARKITFLLTFLAIPLPADFITIHFIDQNLCQSRDGLKGNLLAGIVAV